MKFESKHETFDSRKYISKCCLENGGHFVSASMFYHDIYIVYEMNCRIFVTVPSACWLLMAWCNIALGHLHKSYWRMQSLWLYQERMFFYGWNYYVISGYLHRYWAHRYGRFVDRSYCHKNYYLRDCMYASFILLLTVFPGDAYMREWTKPLTGSMTGVTIIHHNNV